MNFSITRNSYLVECQLTALIAETSQNSLASLVSLIFTTGLRN